MTIQDRLPTDRPIARELSNDHGGGPLRQIRSDQLFCGRHEVEIDHEGTRYRLKITRQGKLILNK